MFPALASVPNVCSLLWSLYSNQSFSYYYSQTCAKKDD